VEKVDRELKHLVQEDWDFKVRKMDHQEYLVVFLTIDPWRHLQNSPA
jgi:hypothetical protein